MDRSRLEESFAAMEAKLNQGAIQDDAFELPEKKELTKLEIVDQRLMAFEEKLKTQEEDEQHKIRKQVEYASEKNPDQMTEVYNMSDRTGIPAPVVEMNFDEFKKNEHAGKIDSKKNPSLAAFYRDQRNAETSHDDIEVLGALEDHLGAFASGIMSFPQMIAGGVAAGTEAGGRILERAIPDSWSQTIREFERDVGVNDLSVAEAFRMAEGGGKVISDYFAPEKSTYTTQLAGGLGQAAAQIGAMLFAPQAAFPMLFAQNVSQQDQRRDGVRADTLGSDLGLLASGGVAVIDKFGLEKLLNRVPPAIQNKIAQKLTDIAIGGGYEAVTEVIENIGHGLIDYATNNPDADIFKGVAEDAAVGGGVGAIIRALLPSYKGTSKVNHQVEENKTVEKTQLEQVRIDKTVELLQQSKTNSRGELKRFTDKLPANHEFKVSTRAFENFEGEIPQFVKDQTDEVSGEFTMTIPQLGTIVNDPELLAAVRPHMRVSDDTLTQAEMSEGGPTTVKNIMEQAAESAKTQAEVEKMTKKVIEQLVDTGMLSKNNARYAAAVIESYVTTKATNMGMSVKEVFKKMNFTVKKLESIVPDFGDTTIEQEKVLEGTGQKVKVREKKQKVYDQKLKQKDIVTKLRDCVNG
jgi:hypothetical protein